MTRTHTWLVNTLANALEPAEREAVLGDLIETNQPSTRALRDLAGLAARRQLALWKHWQPWLLLIALVIPLAAILGVESRWAANRSLVGIWRYAGLGFQLSDLSDGPFFKNFAISIGHLLSNWLFVGCSAWGAGFAVGTWVRRTRIVSLPVWALFVLWGTTVLPPGHGIYSSAIFSQPSFAIPALLITTCFALFPALLGAHHAGSRTSTTARSRTLLLALILVQMIWPTVLSQPGWQHPSALIRAVNWLALLSYWPIAYWIVLKWRTFAGTGASWDGRESRPHR